MKKTIATLVAVTILSLGAAFADEAKPVAKPEAAKPAVAAEKSAVAAEKSAVAADKSAAVAKTEAAKPAPAPEKKN